MHMEEKAIPGATGLGVETDGDCEATRLRIPRAFGH
jgi:hypothetical protein